jgi:hypothetical protein
VVYGSLVGGCRRLLRGLGLALESWASTGLASTAPMAASIKSLVI